MQNDLEIYRKHQSFTQFRSSKGVEKSVNQKTRALRVLSNTYSLPSSQQENWANVLKRVKKALENESDGTRNTMFEITPFIADEMRLLDDKDLPRYLYHRYRYDVFPKLSELDDYPPYLQIEPTSICNYRCVFCFQIDNNFSKRKSDHMGTMTVERYKNIVDQVEGKIEFLSLASRGEPLVCKALPEMLSYSTGKFLNLKINTNASLLTEKLCHALLNGAVRTVVFSADAADPELYRRLRVNGKLEKVVRNIERFQNIRTKYYSGVSIITRISGVKVSREQTMGDMERLWHGLVDQLTFVKYNPWETIYEAPENEIGEPCSDLWRRLFVWFDGTVNPCDSDYLSKLKIGNIDGASIKELWRSPGYKMLRDRHIAGQRRSCEPCRRCVAI